MAYISKLSSACYQINVGPNKNWHSGLSLHAWKPWQERLGAFRFLACLDSPGDFAHWRIYWAGALTLLATTRDVLERVDRKKSHKHAKIIHDFIKHIATKKDLNSIYWNFVCNERNNLVHEFALGAQEERVTSRPFLVDTELSFGDLVKKYGERKVIIWGEDGEDGLRLLEVALQWWERNLRIIEQAVRNADIAPYSSGSQHREKLLGESLDHISFFDYDWEIGSVTPPKLPD